MSLGRAPVIVSGQWQPAPGIRWSECCVVIREDEIASIPAILNELHGNALSMGRRAREFFEENFTRNVFLNRLLKMLFVEFRRSQIFRRCHHATCFASARMRELRTLCHQAQSSMTAFRSDR